MLAYLAHDLHRISYHYYKHHENVQLIITALTLAYADIGRIHKPVRVRPKIAKNKIK